MPAILRKLVCFIQVFVFTITSLVLPSHSYAQSITSPALTLPTIGEAVNISRAFTPVLIKGLTMDQSDPLKFEFLMDQGDSDLQGEDLKSESYKLIKYFMASMTVPEQDLWVNLSPYEKNRIIPNSLGQTEMGRDLLSQDYILKQLTATLMSPEGEVGKKFWEKVYARVYESVGAHGRAPEQNDGDEMQQAIASFNKVWIVPQTGYFYEHNNSVLITDAKLKVMLEEDYVAAQKTIGAENYGLDSRESSPLFAKERVRGSSAQSEEVKQIIRSVIIPIIEDEVNNGENFAPLRQVYNAMLLAVWFKKRIKHHILSEVYVDQRKVSGIDLNDPNANEAIWQRYVETFKSGVADIIQEEYDPATQSIIPKKYFVGGTAPFDSEKVLANKASLVDIGKKPLSVFVQFLTRKFVNIQVIALFVLFSLATTVLKGQDFNFSMADHFLHFKTSSDPYVDIYRNIYSQYGFSGFRVFSRQEQKWITPRNEADMYMILHTYTTFHDDLYASLDTLSKEYPKLKGLISSMSREYVIDSAGVNIVYITFNMHNLYDVKPEMKSYAEDGGWPRYQIAFDYRQAEGGGVYSWLHSVVKEIFNDDIFKNPAMMAYNFRPLIWKLSALLLMLTIAFPSLSAAMKANGWLNIYGNVIRSSGKGLDEWKTDTLPDGRLVHQNGTAQMIGMSKNGEKFVSLDSAFSVVVQEITKEEIKLVNKSLSLNGLPLKRDAIEIDLMKIKINSVEYDKVYLVQFMPEEFVVFKSDQETITIPKGSIVIGRWDESKGFLVIDAKGNVIQDLTIAWNNLAAMTLGPLQGLGEGDGAKVLRPINMNLTWELGVFFSFNQQPFMVYDPTTGDKFRPSKLKEVSFAATKTARTFILGLFSVRSEVSAHMIFIFQGREYVLDMQTSKIVDPAMMEKAAQQGEKTTGGVNLRSDQADIQIQEDGSGFKFPKYDPTMPMMPLQRLTPMILDLKFITIQDAAIKLGLALPADDASDKTYSSEKAKEQEQLSAL